MHVTGLSVRDFRNYERAEMELAPGLNVAAGPNGAGKTNLLEALYVGLTGRSCRTSTERELVRIGEKVARVEAHVAAPDGAHVLEVGIAPGEEQRVFEKFHRARVVSTAEPGIEGGPPSRHPHAHRRAAGRRAAAVCRAARLPSQPLWQRPRDGTTLANTVTRPHRAAAGIPSSQNMPPQRIP